MSELLFGVAVGLALGYGLGRLDAYLTSRNSQRTVLNVGMNSTITINRDLGAVRTGDRLVLLPSKRPRVEWYESMTLLG